MNMIDVLKEVAAIRQQKNASKAIELSSVFMKHLVMNLSNNNVTLHNLNSIEFVVEFNGIPHPILHDIENNFNDLDVEEAVLKLLNQKDNVTKNV